MDRKRERKEWKEVRKLKGEYRRRDRYSRKLGKLYEAKKGDNVWAA